MKIITLTVLSLYILFGGMQYKAFAQSSNLRFGIRAGAGVSFLSKNYFEYYIPPKPVLTNGFSFNGGGIVNVALENNTSIQPELLVTYESAKHSEEFQRTNDNGSLGEKVTFTTTHSVVSVCVPILVKMSFGMPKAGQIGVYVGPNFGYTASVKDVESLSPAKANEPESTRDLTDVSKRFQLGAIVGGDIRVLDNLFVDARFGYKFTKHIDTEIFHGSFSNVSVGIGYWF